MEVERARRPCPLMFNAVPPEGAVAPFPNCRRLEQASISSSDLRERAVVEHVE